MCDDCEPPHKRMKIFSGHETVPVNNFNNTCAVLSANNIYDFGSPVQVSLVAPTATIEDVSASLIHVNSNCSGSSVTENGVGNYSVSLSPQVRGRHDLIVKVKNEEITGSPFRVFVKVPLSQLGRNVHEIGGGLNRPWGIAINNKQQLVVAEFGGKKITIMERDGKKVQTIECAEFRGPRGVATAVDGAIYVTDTLAKCLFKFNSKGKLFAMSYSGHALLRSFRINCML